MKDLKAKAIDIKGKLYVLVSDRVLAFNEAYPNGSINTELISQPDDDRIIIKATIVPDVTIPARSFSDYSQAVIGDGYINKTSALENASTSAVGRALAYMGIGVLESIASADEVRKAESAEEQSPKSSDYKELYSRLVNAKSIIEINNIQEDQKFKSLGTEEKRLLFARMGKAVQNLRKEN